MPALPMPPGVSRDLALGARIRYPVSIGLIVGFLVLHLCRSAH